MPDTNLRHTEAGRRVEEHLEELERWTRDPKILSGEVAGTSEETARLFDSGRTLAQDSTGPGNEE